MTEQELIEEFTKLWGAKGRLRAEWVNFLSKQPCNAYITLTVNDGPKSLEQLRRLLGKWLKRSERRLLGSRHYKLPADERIRGTFVGEKLDTNGHLHGMIVLPDNLLLGAYAHHQIWWTFNREWRRCVGRRGTLQTNATSDAIGGAFYHTKEFKRPDFWAELIWAEDFWPIQKN